MISKQIYNVDVKYQLDRILHIKCPEIGLFIHAGFSDFGIQDTSPEFLGRLRRVKPDGTIAATSECENIKFQNVELVIETNGGMGILNSSTNDYYKFNGADFEQLTLATYPENQLGEYHTHLEMSILDFSNFIDEYYKIKLPEKPKRRKTVQEDTDVQFEEDIYDELAWSDE